MIQDYDISTLPVRDRLAEMWPYRDLAPIARSPEAMYWEMEFEIHGVVRSTRDTFCSLHARPLRYCRPTEHGWPSREL